MNERGSSEKSYSLDDLKKAVEEVKSGKISSWKASRKYNIPRSTIQGLAKGWSNRPPAVLGQSKGRPTALSQETENTIAKSFQIMEKWGFVLSKDFLCDTVQNFVKRNMLSVPFHDGRPCLKWAHDFMQRNNMTLKVAQNVESASFKQRGDPFVINDFFNLLEEHLSANNIQNKPESINLTSVCFDPNGTKVISPIGADPKCQTVGSGKESTTVLACVSASGHILPPHVLFAAKCMQQSWLDPNFPGTSIDVTENGWMTQDAFFRWFENIFVCEVKVRPCILILDGHISHVSIDVIDKAVEENIIVLKLPPHTTHILQPMDISFFRQFKAAWETNVLKFKASSDRKPMGKTQFLEELGNAWGILSPSICKAGFKETGIYPFNRFAIPESTFDPNALQHHKNFKVEQNKSNKLNSSSNINKIMLPDYVPEDLGNEEYSSTVVLKDSTFNVTTTNSANESRSSKCDKFVQTDLSLDKSITDEKFAFLQKMNEYFKGLVCTSMSALDSVQEQSGGQVIPHSSQTSPRQTHSRTLESSLLKAILTTNPNLHKKRKTLGSNCKK